MVLDPLVLAAGGTIVLLAGGGWLVAADRRERASSQRIATVMRAYAPPAPPAAPVPLRRLVQRGEVTGPLGSALTFVGVRTDQPDLYPAPWWVILPITTAIVVAIEFGCEFFIGPVAWVTLPVFWLILMRSVFNTFRNRRTAVLYAQLPDALSMIVRSVRTGLTVQDAMRVVAQEGQWPTTVEFQRVYDEIRFGALLGEALARMAERSTLIEYQFFGVALSLQSQSGGSLAETLENLADVVRKRVALKQRAIALAAEARMTMMVLAVLPFFTAGALLLTSPEYLAPLVTTPLGKKILFAGLVLLALGIGSMKVIIKKATA